MNITSGATSAGNATVPVPQVPATDNRCTQPWLPSGGYSAPTTRAARRAAKKLSGKTSTGTVRRPAPSAEEIRRQAVRQIRAQQKTLNTNGPVHALCEAPGVAEENACESHGSQSVLEYGSDLLRSAMNYGMDLAKSSWRWIRPVVNSLPPQCPGAMAMSPDEAVTQNEMAAERCNVRAGQSGNCDHSSIATLLADLNNEFFIHVSAPLAKRSDQSLAGVTILIADTDEFSAQTQRDLRAALAKYVKPGDELLTVQPDSSPNLPVCREILTPIAAMKWSEIQPPAPSEALDEARKRLHRLLLAVLELIQPALPKKLPPIAAIRQMTFSDLRKMYVTAIHYLNEGIGATLKKEAINEIQTCVTKCEEAYNLFTAEQQQVDVLRSSWILRKIMGAAPWNHSKFLLIEEKYISSFGSSSLSRENTIVLTHKSRPLNVGHTAHDKHLVLIKYFENRLKGAYSLELSPSLMHRADRSLAGVTILIADIDHYSEENQKRIADIVRELRQPGDMLLLEQPGHIKLSTHKCFGRTENCIAIDDAEIRKPGEALYRESNVFLYEAFDILRNAGIQGIPSNMELSKRRLKNELSLLMPEYFLGDVVLDPETDARMRASYLKHLIAFDKFLDTTRATSKERDRKFFQKLSAHVSDSSATFAVLGAAHVANLRERVISKLDAIVVWPKGWTFPDGENWIAPFD